MKKETVENRLDNIEEILKLLLVNSVLGSSDVDKIQENIISQYRDCLSEFGLYNLRMNYIENRYYLFAEVDADETLKNVKHFYEHASTLLENVKLVLVFEKLHARRKKAFEDAEISYYLQSGKMSIF